LKECAQEWHIKRFTDWLQQQVKADPNSGEPMGVFVQVINIKNVLISA